MSGRFTDIPKRLREVAELDHENISYGGWLAISDLMESAALKIEALERELEEQSPDPSALIPRSI